MSRFASSTLCVPSIAHDLRILFLDRAVKTEVRSDLLTHYTFKPLCHIEGSSVCIVAGHGKDEDAFPEQEELLAFAFAGWKGTLLSGGTDTGLPGMLGRISADQAAGGHKDYQLIGYLPDSHQSGSLASPDYDRLIATHYCEDFSVAEPIQMWVDLLSSGVLPEKVRLLGIGGGLISAFEYQLALELGAYVGLVKDSGRSADKAIYTYSPHHRLRALPKDKIAIKAFLNER